MGKFVAIVFNCCSVSSTSLTSSTKPCQMHWCLGHFRDQGSWRGMININTSLKQLCASAVAVNVTSRAVTEPALFGLCFELFWFFGVIPTLWPAQLPPSLNRSLGCPYPVMHTSCYVSQLWFDLCIVFHFLACTFSHVVQDVIQNT